MTTRTSFECLVFFNSLSAVHKAVIEKKLKVSHSYSNRTITGWSVQLVTEAWRQQLGKAEIFCIEEALALYMWYNELQARFFVPSKRIERVSSLKHLTTLKSSDLSLTEGKGVD